MPYIERMRVPDHGSDVLKGFSQGFSCPSLEHSISKYPRLSEESEKESRDEATQRGMVKPYRKQCGSR